MFDPGGWDYTLLPSLIAVFAGQGIVTGTVFLVLVTSFASLVLENMVRIGD